MSDITGGQPIPKAVQSVSHGTDRASGVAKDRQQANEQTKEEAGKDGKKAPQHETLQARDPAVSISASAAHLRIGEELKQKVASVDPEGRPIIVTETATFALRPDAGLKPGDDVILVVKDTSKQLTADLLRHNGSTVDPPIRLNLVVIALHQLEPAKTEVKDTTNPAAASAYKPTRPVIGARVTTTETETDILARVLARKAGGSASTVSSSLSNTNQHTVPTPSAQSNLSALIAAQQNNTSAAKGTFQTSPANAPLLNQPSVSDHILPSSTLTDITAPTTGALLGLGANIPAISSAGQNVNIQLLDPSISKVSPAEVASVSVVRPLTPQDAKALPVAVTSLGNTSALAHVETSKGVFILNQTVADTLAGELIRVTPNSAAPTATAPNAVPVYNAKLIGAAQNAPRNVQIQFLDQQTPQASTPQNVTTVTAVHITRAFLTASGPQSDIRLETPLGDLTMTLPNHIRPAAGVPIALLPLPMTQAAFVSTDMMTAAASGLTTTQWPSLEQAYSLLQSTGMAGAEAFQSLSERSAQGGAKLANSTMFLLSALGGGSASHWIGSAAEKILGERNPQLLDLLKEDIRRLFTLSSDTSGEWRALMLPFEARSQDMPILTLLFGQGHEVDPDKHNKDGQTPEEKDNELKRFVLEVQFSVLGPVQLDGTIKGNRFDLIVRSERQFPARLTQDTSELFSQALAASAFTGSLGFSVEENFPVNVADVVGKMSPASHQQLA